MQNGVFFDGFKLKYMVHTVTFTSVTRPLLSGHINDTEEKMSKRIIVGTTNCLAAPKSGIGFKVTFCIPLATCLTKDANPHRNLYHGHPGALESLSEGIQNNCKV